MHHTACQHVFAQGLHHGFELRAALPHPARHAGAGQVRTAPAVDVFLAVQRQVVIVFGDDDLGEP